MPLTLFALLADIHGNYPALEKVTRDIRRVAGSRRVGYVFLGDAVGYGPDTDLCLNWLAANITARSGVAVAGNHDRPCVDSKEKVNFKRRADDLAHENLEWTLQHASRKSFAVIRRWPDKLVSPKLLPDFTLAHGSPDNPMWGRLLDGYSPTQAFGHFTTRICLVGQTHIPAVFVEPGRGKFAEMRNDPTRCVGEWTPLGERRLIINPGSVGQPRDGNPLASYALLDLEADRIQFRRVRYPIAKVQGRMRKLRLPKEYVKALQVGRL